MKKSYCLTSLILIGLTVSASIHAQSLYRCGSTYQDHPCKGAQKGVKLAVENNSSSPNGSLSDAACVQRGVDAQKIVWAREGGAMKDQQLAKATSPSEKNLINDVYGRHGTSSHIRAAIEADCVAAGDKAGRTAAANDSTHNTSADEPNKPIDAKQKQDESARNKERVPHAAEKKAFCDKAKLQLNASRSTLRSHSGKRDEVTEELETLIRHREQTLKEFGC